MTIPDFQSLMRPVLEHLADGQLHRSREVKEAMADRYDLSEAERAELLPSGRQRTMDNRVGWSLTYLSQAGLVERPARGQVRITAEGRAALARNPERIDMHVLEQYRPTWSSATAPVESGPPAPTDRARRRHHLRSRRRIWWIRPLR